MEKSFNLDDATRDGALPGDNQLKRMKRSEILELNPFERLRWFHLLQVHHPELHRVVTDVLELLQGDADTPIVSLVGMTAAGKTTATAALKNALILHYRANHQKNSADIPVLSITAPANGENSLSWRDLYTRMLQSGVTDANKGLRGTLTTDGCIEYKNGRISVAELRVFLEDMIRDRGVRVLMIDEAFHLLRFGLSQYTAVMDTLKSLAAIGGLKLLLIGNYDLADLMVDYAQVARRTEIVHFQSYLDVTKQRVNQLPELRPSPAKPKDGEITSNEYAFYSVVSKYQDNWPSQNVPNLRAMWWPLMLTSAGAVGLLKMALGRLAYLQLKSPRELITLEMTRKMGKTPSALDKIYSDLRLGTEKVRHVTYGSSISCAINEEQFAKIIGGHNV